MSTAAADTEMHTGDRDSVALPETIPTAEEQECYLTDDELKQFQDVLIKMTSRMKKKCAGSFTMFVQGEGEPVVVSMRRTFGQLMKSMNAAARSVGLPSNCFAIPPTVSALTWRFGFEAIRPAGPSGWLLLNKKDNPDIIIFYNNNVFNLKRCIPTCQQRGWCTFDNLMAHMACKSHDAFCSRGVSDALPEGTTVVPPSNS